MGSSDVARIVGSSMTVSDKIRALDAAGRSRAEIARLLNKRYQHVRNVLEADKARGAAAQSGVSEAGVAFSDAAQASRGASADADVERRGGGVFRLSLRADGSVVLPREVRDALGLAGVAAVMGRLDGDEFTLTSPAAALRRVRQALQPFMREGVSWADELIAERRRDAEREGRDG